MLTRLLPPETLPVGLDEVKAHLRLDHSHEDAYLTTLISAATNVIEEYLGRSLLTQTWRRVWQMEKPYPPHLSLPTDDICRATLPYPPIKKIIAVNRLRQDGSRLPIRRHCLETNHQVPTLAFAQVPEAVEIDYEAGYGDYPADIPAVIRQALLMTVADFYETRDSGALPKNSLIAEILSSYRVIRLP